MTIEWEKIDGYREEMTAEEKLELLEKHNPTPNQESNSEPKQESKPNPTPNPAPHGGTVSKAMYDKVSSDLAAAKKQLRAKMTEDEQKEADRLATEQAMKEELETLHREKTLNCYKASYLSQGYEEALAEATATAMVDGDMDTVFVNMKKHSDSMEKTIRAKILKETPAPPAGDDPEGKGKKNKELAALREAMGLPPTN